MGALVIDLCYVIAHIFILQNVTSSILNYNSFDYFNLKFDHLSYLKKLCKYSQIYVIFEGFC